VVASCLVAPWGLAPLPDGQSALVGERTTGKILLVAPGQQPVLVATVTGLDTSGGGGLLGIALSPYYVEDHLIYAYVTTSKDNRILRIAPGERPKPIFTSIPAGSGANGGPLAFGADGLLYVATGDAGDAAAASEPDSLAGKVLRLDSYGKPAGGNASGTAVSAAGLTDPTGICPLPGGSIGVVDHRGTADLLLPARDGADYTTPTDADALWTYQPGNGGAVDCTVSDGALLATSLAAKKVTSIQMTPQGGFTGSPQDLAAGTFGRLLTIATGPGQLVWMTTSNRDGHGTPVPSDDRVVLLPAGGGGGGGGGAD
jgi:glucose/arabinose dehydrogenase